MSFSVRDSCRLCDAKLPEERVLDLGETCLANALTIKPPGLGEWAPDPTYPLFLKQCSACGHVQLPVVVDPKLLFPAEYPYASATGASMRRHLDDMARELARDVPENGLVVEFGSNDGYLLTAFADMRRRVLGVDPARNLAEAATRRTILTVPMCFDKAVSGAVLNACGEADLIVANNVFAHADDLHEIVEGVKVLLAPTGRFVFEVGYLPDVLRTNNFGTVYHEHLSYHTLRPLVDFFARHDLGLYDAHRVDTQGGSVRCFVRRGPVETPDRLFSLCETEHWTDIAAWQWRVEFAALALREELQMRRSQGKSIAAYGCSAKSTTLLHVAGIGRETIDFICDDAPTKVGKFSPGKHIPIVPGTWLEEKQPDYCVSLSGNFSEAFKAQHPGYRGQWIEPDLGGGA